MSLCAVLIILNFDLGKKSGLGNREGKAVWGVEERENVRDTVEE